MTPEILLVYGARKSGTTLIQRLLDHSDVTCHSGETKVGYFKLIHRSISNEEILWFFQGPSSDDEKRQAVSLVRNQLDSISRLDHYIALSLDVYAEFADGYKGNTWRDSGAIIKEVGANPREVVDGFLAAVPAGWTLIVVRDPRYIASAVCRDRRKRGVALGLLETARKIYEAFATTSAILELRGTERTRFVSYTRVTQNPEEFVREAVETYGFSYTPDPFPTQGGTQSKTRTASDPSSAHTVFIRSESWWSQLRLAERLLIGLFAVGRYDIIRNVKKFEAHA